MSLIELRPSAVRHLSERFGRAAAIARADLPAPAGPPPGWAGTATGAALASATVGLWQRAADLSTAGDVLAIRLGDTATAVVQADSWLGSHLSRLAG